MGLSSYSSIDVYRALSNVLGAKVEVFGADQRSHVMERVAVPFQRSQCCVRTSLLPAANGLYMPSAECREISQKPDTAQKVQQFHCAPHPSCSYSANQAASHLSTLIAATALLNRFFCANKFDWIIWAANLLLTNGPSSCVLITQSANEILSLRTGQSYHFRYHSSYVTTTDLTWGLYPRPKPSPEPLVLLPPLLALCRHEDCPGRCVDRTAAATTFPYPRAVS